MTGQKIKEDLLKNPFIITDGVKYYCNNWRKLNKIPMRRKGSSLVVIKIKFEHHTTKKQKRRWKKKHCINPFDIVVN